MRSALKKIINYAVEVARPERIVLFGSLARGTTNLYSDIDLLIVTSDRFSRRDLALRISEFARECGVSADVLVHTPAQIAEAAMEPSSFLHQVVVHGEIVYEKS
jgi:predicted nucleotidyltransferase